MIPLDASAHVGAHVLAGPRRRGLRETDRQTDRQKPFLSRNPKPSPLLEGWRTRDRRQDLLKLLGGEGGEKKKKLTKRKKEKTA